VPLPSESNAAELLAREAAARLDPAALLAEEDRTLLARVALLREAMPELDFPEMSAAQLGKLLPSLCAGCQSFDDLKRAGIRHVFLSQLTPIQQQALERHAPQRMSVPSGSQIALTYEPGRPPILAVRIQEMFG